MPKDRDTVRAALREGISRSSAEYVTILREDLLLILGPEPEQVLPELTDEEETDP